VLDVGAAGLVVPHVDSAAQAAEVVSRARYRGGVRGFSSSPRSAGYGTLGMKAALEAGDRSLIMCQIESAEAVEAAPAIAAVPGVDGLFIGRADLARSLGEDNIQSDRVSAACTRIIDAARAAGKPAMFVATAAERDRFAAQGVTWFIVGSDQSLLRQAAQSVAAKTPDRRP
jgi:2-keto-3-deoxy-L-rhamnonate aldolase RhmA